MRRWYVVTPEHGIEFFNTEDAENEAKTYAHEAMASWRREASEGGEWVEEIGELEWGEVICHERAVCTKSEPDPNSKYGDTLEAWELKAPPVWTAADVDEMDATAERLSAAFAAEDESQPLKPSELERFEQRDFHRSDRHFKEVE